MILLILSFLAGVLTVAAPCVLPLLPVIVGGSVVGKPKSDKDWLRPVFIAGSLAVSIIIFTLLIKATTVLLSVPLMAWQIVSGSIVLLLGLYYLWPHGWEKLSGRLSISSNKTLGKAYQKKGYWGAVLIGAALGPVFSSCSPTYALIVASVLPASFLQGLIYLAAYALGMSATLLLIAYAGQAMVKKLGWLSNPNGCFKHLVGILFVVVGLAVIFGLDRDLQAFILERGWYDPISSLENKLMH